MPDDNTKRPHDTFFKKTFSDGATVLTLLRVKFGKVSDADVARVERADDEAVEHFLERVLTTDSVAAVLDG
ncbi:MAG: hypothetical protein JKY37_00865 [Nannocystaceae bacterium]|nr:hypothetical protein [Nannocystaceae bacterium]